MLSFLREALKGAVIGLANVIPGVSGGTMMVSMGIFDKLIYSITHLFKQFKKSILTLLPYVVGMLVSIVAFSFVVTFLFDRFPMQTSSAFVGLILGGVPVLVKRVRGRHVGVAGIVLFVVFCAGIILLQIFGSGVENETVIAISFLEILKLLLIGAVASATMIIPGVSGSMMLMILGYYKPVIGAVRNFAAALAGFDTAAILYNMGILIPFAVGIVLGIFAVAKMLEVLIKKWEGLTYCAILGLVAASPVVVFLSIGIGTLSVLSIIGSLITFAAGLVCALWLSKGEEAPQTINAQA